jgi:translation initiation factor eIF-2B subunit epsilon
MGPKVDLRGEDLVQAVVVADSFSSAFAPLTQTTPACLLPLSGRPLIEYTLEVNLSGVLSI